MKTLHPFIKSTVALAFALIPSVGMADVFNFDNNNSELLQSTNGASVLDDSFNFLGGNDRLILLRNDDLAGLRNGVADMGSGRDVVITSFNMSGTFNLGSGNDLFTSEGVATLSNIIVLAGTGNDIIAVATNFGNYFGEDGNDVFLSDGGGNNFDGGDGNDTYSAELAGEAANIDLLERKAFVRFNLTAETLISIENARGTDFNDTIFGDSNANRIDGLGGDDSIDGDPGNDTISGGAGTNTLVGNTGVDTLVIVGTITSKFRQGSSLRVIGTTGGVAFNDTATGFEQVLDNGVLKSIAFFLGETTTNGVQQTVIDESSVLAKANALAAGQTLNGNGNANTISGGTGSDDIAGLGGNDRLNGRGGDDALFGGTQDDTLDGGTGDDILDGGPGHDRLTGGPGKDTFVFASPLSGSADVIADYTVVDDTIRISRGLVGNLPIGDLSASQFKNTAHGSIDSGDRIIYESSTGKLSFDSNGSGPDGRVLIATLPRGRNVTAGEIKIQ